MLEGEATHDFGGSEVRGQFEKLAAQATVRGFDVGALSKLGAQINPLVDGAFMEDGSVVFTDFTSWQTSQAKPFAIKLSGFEFSGSYVGIFALKVDRAGEVEKLVCGGFSELNRDGRPIFSLQLPADVVITRTASRDYRATIVSQNVNPLKMYAN